MSEPSPEIRQSAAGRRSEPPRLFAAADGLRFAASPQALFAWEEVELVEARRVDVDELLCLEIRAGGQFHVFHEEMPCFHDLLAILLQHLPGFPATQRWAEELPGGGGGRSGPRRQLWPPASSTPSSTPGD